MNFIPTKLKDAFIIEPKVFSDDRGYFFESFKHSEFLDNVNPESYLIDANKLIFVQENQSFSKKNTFRGFHFQTGGFAQSKLVSVAVGAVLDIIIDLRKESETYKQHIAVELDDQFHKQLFVPRGFAHGFLVTSEYAIFQYKCDNYYNKSSESGLSPLDPILKDINWPIDVKDLIINERDLNWKNYEG